MPFGIEGYLVSRIQKSAQKYGGDCTFSFSQSLNPVASMIGKSKVSRGGVCQALSEKWVVMHAHDGSLWSWLYPNGSLSSSALSQMAYNFMHGSTVNGTKSSAITDQDQNSDLYLMRHGLRRRTDLVCSFAKTLVNGALERQAVGQRSLVDHSGGSRLEIGQKLGKELVSGSMVQNMGMGDGTYRIIGIYGGSSSHCMCVYVGTDVCFFDPNFGEFWFPHRDAFAMWFGEYFWPKSFYDRTMAKRFTIRDYARAVGSGVKNYGGKF